MEEKGACNIRTPPVYPFKSHSLGASQMGKQAVKGHLCLSCCW